MAFVHELGLQTVFALAAFGALVTLTGLPLARLLPVGSAQLTLAALLGLAVHGVSASLWFLAAPPTRLSALTHAGLLACLCWLAWHRLADKSRRRPQVPGQLAVWVLCIPLGVLACVEAWPRLLDGGMYLPPAMHDHARIVFIDAIARHGIPAPNPLYAPGESVNLVYYYFWPLLAAEMKWLTGCTGWAADLALTWLGWSAVLACVGGLAMQMAGQRRAAAWAIALSLSGAPLALASGTGVAEPGGFRTVFEQVRWAPHHVLAAGALTLLLYLLAHRARSSSLAEDLVLVCLSAFAAGCGGWAAGALAVAGPLLAALLFRSLGALAVVRLMVVAATSLLVILPLVTTVTGAPCAHDGPVVTLALLTAVSGAGSSALQIVGYWLWFLPWVLGPIWMLGIFGLTAGLGASEGAVRRFLALSLAATLVVLLVCQCLRSLPFNNDLGWRANLLPQLLLTLAAAVALSKRATWRTRLPSVVLVVVGLASGYVGLPAWNAPPVARDPKVRHLRQAFGDQVRAYAVVRAHTPRDQRMLSNPYGFAELLPWPINIDYLLFADRDSVFAHPNWVVTYCPGATRTELATLHRLARNAFAAPRPEELRALRDRFGVRTLLVRSQDASFGSKVYEASGAYRLVHQDPEFAVYRAVRASP